jgi:hypothetical protein
MTTTDSATTELLSAATLIKLRRDVDKVAARSDRWWKKQTPRMRLALAVAGVFAAASILNLAVAGVGRMTTTRPASVASAPAIAAPPALTQEAAPNDAGKSWTVVKVWQGTGSRDTEAFTVGEHWRVDWLFSPGQAGSSLQVYVFAANGRLLLNMAANTQKSGADSSFWMGPGTYFLKINGVGGDWKLDVQDLH